MILKHIKKIVIYLLVFSLGFVTACLVANEYSKKLSEQKSTFVPYELTSVDNNESIYIISPKSGDEVTNPVKVIFGLNNMEVAPAGTKKDNTGHHHLLVNLDELPDLQSPLPSNKNLIHFGLGQTETEIKLKKGINTLQLILGDYMHKPHKPPLISKKIRVFVR